MHDQRGRQNANAQRDKIAIDFARRAPGTVLVALNADQAQATVPATWVR